MEAQIISAGEAEPKEPLAQRFRREGFLTFERLVDAETLERLREGYERILAREVMCKGDRKLGGLVRQVMCPEVECPLFTANPALDAGRAIAHEIFGAEPEAGFQMLIYKEPCQLNETPWHQDYAYVEMPYTPAGVEIPYDAAVMFWLALDDVDVENGCMHFVPGEHLKPLAPHHVASGDPEAPNRLLAIDEPGETLDLGRAVACPLPAGGATMHSPGTPHFTPGNRTKNRPRRAYIFNFSRPRPNAG